MLNRDTHVLASFDAQLSFVPNSVTYDDSKLVRKA